MLMSLLHGGVIPVEESSWLREIPPEFPREHVSHLKSPLGQLSSALQFEINEWESQSYLSFHVISGPWIVKGVCIIPVVM